MSEIVIEKGVPVPPKSSRADAKYPFGAMEIGDSFAADQRGAVLSARACGYAKQHPGRRFTVRSTGPNSCRVWRIA